MLGSCYLFDVFRLTFSLQTAAAATLYGVLTDGFGEAAVARDMPEPFELPSLDSCQRRFLCANEEADLALHPVVGFLLQAGDAEKVPHVCRLQSRDLFLQVRKQDPRLTEEDGDDERIVQLEFACQANSVASRGPV